MSNHKYNGAIEKNYRALPTLHHEPLAHPHHWPSCEHCHHNPCCCDERDLEKTVCLPADTDVDGYVVGIKKRRHGLDARLTAVVNFIIKLLIVLFVIFVIASCIYVYTKYCRTVNYDIGYADGVNSAQTNNALRFFPFTTTAEGGPCTTWDDGLCEEAENATAAIRFSRYYLRMGDAQSALRDWDQALRFYRQSIFLGSSNGAQSAILAAKRIQFQLMTCEYNEESLARISRGFEHNPLGALIEMRQKQTSLTALGYFTYPVDNTPNAATRDAIRDFQGDLWFDQTGVLTAEQTVLLICGGAQIAKDEGSQNILGIMYAGGLGVRQSTDFALNWFESAAQKGDADAAWNLALMYGTGTVRASVLICDAVQNAERADSYLSEAADLRHPAARHAIRKYPSDTPTDRWRKLRGDLSAPEILDRVGRGCNPNL